MEFLVLILLVSEALPDLPLLCIVRTLHDNVSSAACVLTGLFARFLPNPPRQGQPPELPRAELLVHHYRQRSLVRVTIHRVTKSWT